MKKIVKTLLITLLISVSFVVFSRYSEKKLYPEYTTLYDYRRMTPELFPSSSVLKIISIGHNTTYADMLWVNLVQFIGDNIGNNKYLDFSHALLSNITDLSPYFYHAYELDLIYTPLVYADSQDNMSVDEKEKTSRAIAHGKEGMELFCDKNKIMEIDRLPYGNTLWSRKDLQNPCTNGMIPYYIGFHYANAFEDGKNASYYYKIASMQDDAPEASKFLGPIALTSLSDPVDSALSFLLIARDGYDKDPYVCKKLTNSIILHLQKKLPIDENWLAFLQKEENALSGIKDAKDIESYSSTNCHDSLRRGIKQIYIAYITEKAKSFPDIENAKDLVEKKIIPSIPTISSQSGFTLRKRDGKWMFRNY